MTMPWTTGERRSIEIDGVALESECWGAPPESVPTIVLLHEGLGCVARWRDFPAKLAQETGYGVFAYSRQGYGGSDACNLPRPIDYMEREAADVLPRVLDLIGFGRGVLLGHSDGATIAALYLGSHQDHRVRGLGLMAPHFFSEPEQLEAIRDIRRSFETTDLRDRLARHHGSNIDCAFYGWNSVWLDPEFESWDVSEVIGYIRVPILYIQGEDDAYGSRAQADVVVAESYAPVDVEFIENCGHSPHLDQPERTLETVATFVERLDRIEAAVAVGF